MSEIKLQDYLSYYLGCRVMAAPYGGQQKRYEEGKLIGINVHDIAHVKLDNWQSVADVSISCIKPILRKLEDISEDEAKEMQGNILPGWAQNYPARWHKEEMLSFITNNMRPTVTPKGVFNVTHYLLTKGFDLFSLIESGLAIDSKTLK